MDIFTSFRETCIVRSSWVQRLNTLCLLAVSIPPGGTYFWSGVDGQSEVIGPLTFSSVKDNDRHPEDTYRRVHVSVGTTAFHEFATTSGSLTLPVGKSATEVKIPQGQSRKIAFSLKSLDEILGQTPDFARNLYGHRLYAVKVTIISQQTVNGGHQPEKKEEYYICRFVSALRRTGLDGQPTPEWEADLIPFESTLSDPRRQALGSPRRVNAKILQVVGDSPTLEVKNLPNSGESFWDAGGTAGAHILCYEPTAAGLGKGFVELKRGDKLIGKIKLLGTGISPKVWSVDAAVFARELQRAFINGAQYESKKPGHFRKLADRILNDVELTYSYFWRYRAMRAETWGIKSKSDIDIQVEFEWDVSKDSNPRPHTGLVIKDLLRGLQALKAQYQDVNAVTYAYYFDRLLHTEAAYNQRTVIRLNVPAFGQYPDAADTEDARRHWVKVLAHELGHAHLFTGHIIPDATPKDSIRYFDLMQSGVDRGDRPFLVEESSHYLNLATGWDWSPGNVKAALDMITTTGSVAPGKHAHDPFQEAGSELLLPWMWITDATVSEAAGTASLEVRLSAPSAVPIPILCVTADGTATAGSDYKATVKTLTFQPGTTVNRDMVVPIINDARHEPDEQFRVYLDAEPFWTRIPLSDREAICTIRDDDRPPAISISKVVVRENAGKAVFTVSLSAKSGNKITVKYTTVDGTAVAGKDYQARSGTLTFPAGTKTQSIAVPIINDSRREPDETFKVKLSAATNATIGSPTAIGTIKDDD